MYVSFRSVRHNPQPYLAYPVLVSSIEVVLKVQDVGVILVEPVAQPRDCVVQAVVEIVVIDILKVAVVAAEHYVTLLCYESNGACLCLLSFGLFDGDIYSRSDIVLLVPGNVFVDLLADEGCSSVRCGYLLGILPQSKKWFNL